MTRSDVLTPTSAMQPGTQVRDGLVVKEVAAVERIGTCQTFATFTDGTCGSYGEFFWHV